LYPQRSKRRVRSSLHKMKRVYLISPSEQGLLANAGDRPPLGILYIASYLRENGVSVRVADMNHMKISELADELMHYYPTYIGISFSTPLYERAVQLLRFCRAFVPRAKFVAGGPHPSASPESCDEFDYVIVGEGEEAMLELVTDESY